jgi:hypothetical protein
VTDGPEYLRIREVEVKFFSSKAMCRNGQYFPLLYSRKAVENATGKRKAVPGGAQ